MTPIMQVMSIAIALLAAGNIALGWLWQKEVKEFAEFKGAIVVLGEEAQKHKNQVEAEHKQTAKELKDDWERQLPKIRSAAVDNYKRRFPLGLCRDSGSSPMPGNASSPQALDGTQPERVAPEHPIAAPDPIEITDGTQVDDFAAACGEDVLALRQWRAFAVKNKLKVVD